MNIDNVLPLIDASVFLLVATAAGYAISRKIVHDRIHREGTILKAEPEERILELTTGYRGTGTILRELSSEAADKERRSTKRDWILFGAGVVVTAVLTLLIQALTQ